MSKKEVIQEESLFKNINLSDKREENESNTPNDKSSFLRFFRRRMESSPSIFGKI